MTKSLNGNIERYNILQHRPSANIPDHSIHLGDCLAAAIVAASQSPYPTEPAESATSPVIFSVSGQKKIPPGMKPAGFGTGCIMYVSGGNQSFRHGKDSLSNMVCLQKSFTAWRTMVDRLFHHSEHFHSTNRITTHFGNSIWQQLVREMSWSGQKPLFSIRWLPCFAENFPNMLEKFAMISRRESLPVICAYRQGGTAARRWNACSSGPSRRFRRLCRNDVGVWTGKAVKRWYCNAWFKVMMFKLRRGRFLELFLFVPNFYRTVVILI